MYLEEVIFECRRVLTFLSTIIRNPNELILVNQLIDLSINPQLIEPYSINLYSIPMIRLVNFPDQKDTDLQDPLFNQEDQLEDKQILEKFIVPLPIFNRIEKVQHSGIQVIQKKVIAFATQYGPNNQYTTKMLYNLLETSKETGCDKLDKKHYQAAIYFFTKCLGFNEPPENYVYKFLQSKVDVVNKLIHVLLTYKKNQKSNIEMGFQFIQPFLHDLEKSSQYERLVTDVKSSVEFNYFFAGRLSQKCKNQVLAIKYLERCVNIINTKMEVLNQSKMLTPENKNQVQDKLLNLKIKSYYKISKSYRAFNEKEQQRYQNLTLTESKTKKYDLFIHISRKIREFREKRNFKEVLNGLESRKKIENEVFRLIEESKKKEYSLYSFYQEKEENEEEKEN